MGFNFNNINIKQRFNIDIKNISFECVLLFGRSYTDHTDYTHEFIHIFENAGYNTPKIKLTEYNTYDVTISRNFNVIKHKDLLKYINELRKLLEGFKYRYNIFTLKFTQLNPEIPFNNIKLTTQHYNLICDILTYATYENFNIETIDILHEHPNLIFSNSNIKCVCVPNKSFLINQPHYTNCCQNGKTISIVSKPNLLDEKYEF